uniref:Uncharacterized protein n=1 Tax=Macrostomum lignano TaxID=282301 RepID=A0A1I8J3S0_9PLAT
MIMTPGPPSNFCAMPVSAKKRIPTFLRMVDRVLGGMKRQPFPRMDLLSTSESDAEPPRSLHQRPHGGIDSDSAEGVESGLQLLPPPQQKVLPTATSGAMSGATGMMALTCWIWITTGSTWPMRPLHQHLPLFPPPWMVQDPDCQLALDQQTLPQAPPC